jgi:hypothetical protein
MMFHTTPRHVPKVSRLLVAETHLFHIKIIKGATPHHTTPTLALSVFHTFSLP